MLNGAESGEGDAAVLINGDFESFVSLRAIDAPDDMSGLICVEKDRFTGFGINQTGVSAVRGKELIGGREGAFTVLPRVVRGGEGGGEISGASGSRAADEGFIDGDGFGLCGGEPERESWSVVFDGERGSEVDGGCAGSGVTVFIDDGVSALKDE